jgi:hypothetical protein
VLSMRLYVCRHAFLLYIQQDVWLLTGLASSRILHQTSWFAYLHIGEQITDMNVMEFSCKVNIRMSLSA